METSVIIANFNGKRYLEACIEALLRQSYTDFEIVLVDNASKDGSLEFLRRKYGDLVRAKRLRLIRNQENEGFAEGNNIGVRAARGECIVLLNNDTRVDRHWLGVLVRTLKDHPKAAIVGSCERTPDPQLDRALKQEQWLVNVCGEPGMGPIDEVEPGVRRIFAPAGNGIAFRKKEIPVPFDPTYFAYAEDIHLAWRVRLLGRETLQATRATMFHHGGSTKQQGGFVSKVAVFNGTKNQIMNFLLFYQWRNVLRIAPLFALNQLGHIVQNPRKLIVKLKAYFWTVVHLRMILRERKRIQRERVVPDATIISMLSGRLSDERFVTSWQKTALRAMNRLFLEYCRIVGLPVIEFRNAPKRRKRRPQRAAHQALR